MTAWCCEVRSNTLSSNRSCCETLYNHSTNNNMWAYLLPYQYTAVLLAICIPKSTKWSRLDSHEATTTVLLYHPYINNIIVLCIYYLAGFDVQKPCWTFCNTPSQLPSLQHMVPGIHGEGKYIYLNITH